MHLCLKVNKRRRKCHVCCVGVMPEGRERRRQKIYNDEVFRPQRINSKSGHRTEKSIDGTPSGRWPGEGPDDPGLRSRDKSKCTRLANVKTCMIRGGKRNKHDQMFWVGSVAGLSRQNKEKTKMFWIGLVPALWTQNEEVRLSGYIVSQPGIRGVMVIVAGYGHGDTSSNPGLIAFHIALIPLGKVWIQLFSLQLWVNSRAD